MIKVLIIAIDIILILLDIILFVRFLKICKEKSIGEAIETKYIIPYLIAMSVIAILISGINLIASVYRAL